MPAKSKLKVIRMVYRLLLFTYLICSIFPVNGTIAQESENTGYKIVKVNHELIDREGNTHQEVAHFKQKAIYQKELRNRPDVTGIRFFIHWKAPSSKIPNFVVRLDARGVQGETGKEVMDSVVRTYSETPGYSGWTTLEIKDEAYQKLEKMMAWKVTLLQRGKPVAVRKSFTWGDSALESQENPDPENTNP